jgi:hypothetical protein
MDYVLTEKSCSREAAFSVLDAIRDTIGMRAAVRFVEEEAVRHLARIAALLTEHGHLPGDEPTKHADREIGLLGLRVEMFSDWGEANNWRGV